jgi:hypothetical protein
MATVNGKTPGLSNLVLKSHPWMDTEGFGVEIATTAAAMGQVMRKTAGVWAAITALPAATDVLGVVLDETKEDSTRKRILKSGDAILKESGLVYFAGATTPNKVAIHGFLENVHIQVNDAAQVIATA